MVIVAHILPASENAVLDRSRFVFWNLRCQQHRTVTEAYPSVFVVQQERQE